jgi:hypothetical protein
MKQEIIQTKKSKLVLQVYHNYFLYHKDMKSFSDRKELTKWKSKINSKSAYLEDGKLILSKSDYNPDLINCDLIILNDFNSESEIEAAKNQNQRWQKDLVDFEERTDGKVWANLKQVQYFTLAESHRKFEIFQLKKVDTHIELQLLYDLYEIGEPKRENFKLCKLEMNTPIEIKINGKLDHSLSSGRERSYKEHCYIFHLIGETDEFELAREPFKGSVKQIPKPLKSLNLMKELY